MDDLVQLYRRSLGAALHASVKRAAPSPFGGPLSALGDRLDHSIADGSAATAVGNFARQSPGVVGGVLKNTARDLTYGPLADLKTHVGQGIDAARAGDWRGVAGAGLNAGLDGLSGTMNAGILLGEPLTGGADSALIPAKEGLMYGLRRMAVGGAKALTPGLMAGSPRAALTDGVRALAQPALGGGVVGDAVRAGGGLLNRGLDAASSWIHNSTNPAVKLLTGSFFPQAAQETAAQTAKRYAGNAAVVGTHAAIGLGAPLAQNALQSSTAVPDWRSALRGLNAQQLHDTLAQAYGEANVPHAMTWLQQNGFPLPPQ